MRTVRGFAVLSIALGLIAMTAGASSADEISCEGILGQCNDDDHCHGEFAIQTGCDITCYVTVIPPPPDPPYWDETGDASCTPIG